MQTLAMQLFFINLATRSCLHSMAFLLMEMQQTTDFPVDGNEYLIALAFNELSKFSSFSLVIFTFPLSNLSKFVSDFRSFLSPESPFSPYMVIYTLASVPALKTSPVKT